MHGAQQPDDGPTFYRDDPKYYMQWTSPTGRVVKVQETPEMNAVLDSIIHEPDPDKLAAMGMFFLTIGEQVIDQANRMRADLQS